MADVSVEFGAVDVGLEKTLKTIQDEISRLEGSVKSGNLPLDELQAKMREISKLESAEKRIKAMGDASAESSPKIQSLGNDIDRAGDKAQSAAGIFDAEFQKIAGAFTAGNLAAEGFQKVIDLAFDAARAVVQGFSDALDLGGRLNELSSRTGETAGKLLVLETAFKNSGLEAEQVGTAINKLQNFMQDAANGGEKQRAAMDGLGISMADLAGKTPTEQMQIFADKIASIEDPTQRAATASEVFGDKLGGKLLPLFSDFSGNLADARDKVGSLEEVMDENAATFDAAAETIEAVKGKMAAFAAGVLGETIPALQDLGKSMEQVDAAGLGTSVGEFLSPRLEKLGFVVLGLVEEFKGLVDIIQEVSGEGTFLGQVVDRILELNTAMQNTINFISPMDDLFNILEQKGRAAAEAQDQAAQSIKGTGTAAQEATTGLENVGTASDTATGKVDALGTSAQATGQNIATAFTLTSDFAPKLEEISGSWGGVNEQILGGKNLLTESYNLADSMTGKIEEQTAGFGGVNEQLTTSNDLAKLIDETYGSHAEKLAEIQDKQDALALKEEERKEKLQSSLEFELEINKAKAAGDAELVKTLENQKLFNDELQKAVAAGLDNNTILENGLTAAENFAAEMTEAKIAAQDFKLDSSSVSTAKGEAGALGEKLKTVKEILDDASKAKLEAPAKNFSQRLDEAQDRLSRMKDFIGEDMGRMDLADIIQKLGLDVPALSSSQEQIKAVEEAIKSLEDAAPEDITPKIDEVGSNDKIKSIKEYLDGLKDKDATPKIDTEKVKGEANTAKTDLEDKFSNIAAGVKIKEEDFEAAKSKITSLSKEKVELPTTLKIDREDFKRQLDTLQADIKNSFKGGDGGPGGPGGNGGAGGPGGNAVADINTLQKVVESIKILVEKIEPKLPVAALAA